MHRTYTQRRILALMLLLASVPVLAATPAVMADAPGVASACPKAALSSQPYLLNAAVDFVDLVGPPPAPGSTAAASDLEEVIEAQREAHRTGTTARAIGDAEVNCLRFADVLGPAFSAARAPLAVYFLNRAALAGTSAVGPGKTYWWRPRPYVMSTRVERLADIAPGAVAGREAFADFDAVCNPGAAPHAPRLIADLDPQRAITSYPSGHAAFGMSCAILLAEMVPEKRSELFERAREYGQSRLIVGAHFPSDIEAGRALAAVSAAQMQQNAAFRRDFDAARIELRAVLGLPRDPPDLRPQRPEPPPALPAPGAR